MMRTYETPEMELLVLDASDVIETSGEIYLSRYGNGENGEDYEN